MGKIPEHKRRSHRRETEPTHWLEEGWEGVSSLFDDLDLFGFVVDAALSSRANRISHQFRGEKGTKPLAVVVPPAGALSWQAAFLARDFVVSMWTEEIDPLFEQVRDHYGIEMFEGELPQQFSGLVDVYLISDTQWSSASEFHSALDRSVAELALDGWAYAILKGQASQGELRIPWRDGSTTSLRELKAQLGSDTEIVLEPTADFPSRMSDFLQRHREYYGRNVTELCAARLREDDILIAAKSWDHALLIGKSASTAT